MGAPNLKYENDVSMFYSTLFDSEQSTCFTYGNKGTTVYPTTQPPTNVQFFSINALHPEKDLDPRTDKHSATRPRRADANVVCYRNILLEFDKGSIEEQQELVEKLNLPYSTCVFSGGKSLHYIISLETPLQTAAEYRVLANRLYYVIGSGVDSTCKNPSRLSRAPGVMRYGTNNEQKLIAVRGRVKNAALEQWLVALGSNPPVYEEPTMVDYDQAAPQIDGLRPGTCVFLMAGAPAGMWNIQLFKAACDLYRNGRTKEEIHQLVFEINNLLDAADRNTIDSAIKDEESRLKRMVEQVRL